MGAPRKNTSCLPRGLGSPMRSTPRPWSAWGTAAALTLVFSDPCLVTPSRRTCQYWHYSPCSRRPSTTRQPPSISRDSACRLREDMTQRFVAQPTDRVHSLWFQATEFCPCLGFVLRP